MKHRDAHIHYEREGAKKTEKDKRNHNLPSFDG